MGDGWAPTELLGRLAAKGPQYSMAPGGSPKYTMEDIAGALAGLPYPVYCYARVKYCGDSEDAAMNRILMDEVRRKVRLWAHSRRWRGEGRFFDGIAALVVEQSINAIWCKRCNGTGSVIELWVVEPQVCPRCDGLGVKTITNAGAAEMVHDDMTEDAWRKTWAARYKEVMREVLQWDSVIEGHLRKKLLRKGA